MINKLLSIVCALALAKAGFAFGPVDHKCGQITTFYENGGDAAHDIMVQFKSCPSRDCSLVVHDSSGNFVSEKVVPAGQTKTFTLAVPKGGTLSAYCSGKQEDVCTTAIQ